MIFPAQIVSLPSTEGRPGYSAKADAAHNGKGHTNAKMTCYACHSSWTTSCFGCHLPMRANARASSMSAGNAGTLTTTSGPGGASRVSSMRSSDSRRATTS